MRTIPEVRPILKTPHCSLTTPQVYMDDKPYQDAREQAVEQRPAQSFREPMPEIHPLHATPVSIAWAKRRAAEERAEVQFEIRRAGLRAAKNQLRLLVAQLGVLDVRTLLDEIEGE